jgi:endonuclease/exonuclease/phosphatase family metal-dependent hydrolase
MRLLTWNIQWGRGCDGRVDLARIARVAHETVDADVICLQEVAVNFPGLAGSSGEDQVQVLREAFPGYRAFYGVATDLPDNHGERSHFGNLILSRLPVLQVFRHLLPWPVDATVASMQRVCVEAVVETGIGPIRVMTTHLEYYSPRQRMAQVKELRRLHRQASAHAMTPRLGKDVDPTFGALPRGRAAILCGDFNFRPGDPEHAVLSAGFGDRTPRLADAWMTTHTGQPHDPTVGLHGCEWPETPYCCDFFFVSRDLLPRLTGMRVNSATDASDHQPLANELDA